MFGTHPALTGRAGEVVLGKKSGKASITYTLEKLGIPEPDDAAMLLAYILKLNGMPSGNATLSADIPQLKQIKIELKPAAPKPSQR